MSSRPDAVVSSSFAGSGPAADGDGVVPMSPKSSVVPLAPTSTGLHDVNEADEDDDDPIVREINVYISPEISNTLHLLQFPIHSAVAAKQAALRRDSSLTPAEAKFRPKHNMLELEYPIPPSAQEGQRQLSDKMCLSQRTFTSNAIAPVTHMALAKMNRKGTSLYVVPMQKHVMQMRPSFRHLHDEEDEDPTAAVEASEAASSKSGGRNRPVMFAKKETERNLAQKRNTYQYQRAAEESEEWIELDVHGNIGAWSSLRKEFMGKVRCPEKEHDLKVAENPKSADVDGGYVKSLNYLDSFSMLKSSGEGFVENLSDWAPSAVDTNATIVSETSPESDVDMMADDAASSSTPATPIGATEQATAELASKLAVLLQTGNGAMIPYRILRSRFNVANVSNDILTMALSSCAVLVRGNFALKSNLCKFLSVTGGGEGKKQKMMELRDLILLIFNMHGMVQRERLVRAYVVKAEGNSGYSAINADMISFVLQTVAKKGQDCWVAKVGDDEEFAADFPEVAACHGVFWMKKKKMLHKLVELYENADVEEDMEWDDAV